MKTLLLSLLIGLQISNHSEHYEASEVLERYIQWTSTGNCKEEEDLFSDEVSLTYFSNESIQKVSFQDYHSKIKSAANSVPRDMRIIRIIDQGDFVKAEIEDVCQDQTFSLVHHLNLVYKNDRWKIQSIQMRSKI